MYKFRQGVDFFRPNILLLVMVASLSCGLSDLANPSVHYVLPNAYLGMFKVILDEKGGTEVEKNGGRYTYEIPDDGILKLKNFEPLRQMHEETAAYRNGERITIPDSKASDDTIALRSVGQHTRGDGPFTIIFVLGKKQHADKVKEDLENPEFDDIPPRVYNQRLMQQ